MIDIPEIPKNIQIVADHYHKATGIPCSTLDTVHKFIVHGSNELEALFAKIDPLWVVHCLETHFHSAMLSERFGGSYIYFGLLSLLYWVSPVIMHGTMDYAIIAGPVMTLDPSEILEEHALEQEEDKTKILELLNTIPHIDINRIHSLSEVLRMCSGWASGYSEHRMVESRQSLELQSRLSENIQDMKNSSQECFHCYPIEKESAMQEAVRWGNKPRAIVLLNEILGIILFSSGASFDRITFRVLEIISLLSRAAVQGGANEEKVLEKTFLCQKEIRYYSSLEGLSIWLSKILDSYIDMVIISVNAEFDPTIAQALRYIHSHYSEHLSLEETARCIKLSPNYFSSLFNSRMGKSFSSYVNQIRVEKAQKLLLDTSLPIIEIAGMVGFEEQSYFSKIFKDISTISPGRYRKRGASFTRENHEIHS